MSLDDLRRRIDAVDTELVRLLNERTRCALEIGRLKREHGGEIYVPAREREVLERVTGLNEGPLTGEAVRAIYREVMSAAIALERPVKVAYLGPSATFTHQAARARFGSSVAYESCATISDVFAAVAKRACDYGVVPIENSTEGAVTHTLDEFAETPLRICAEIYLPIALHLLGRGPREAIRKVYSKAEVFGQCRRWLQERMPDVEQVPVSSTARAAEMAAAEPGSGALAAALAAELYGLDVIEREIQDLGGNTTRFLVIAPTYGRASGADRTSVFFGVRDKVGALYEALAAFSRHGINLCKIESRPSRAKAWEYNFFVDVEGHADDPGLRAALGELKEHCTTITVLGSYPKAGGRAQ